ncbi:cupin domain-containing protein [Sphingopyxis sp. 113P3]|uniref:cupin domain-containing protein n=1 Tax=Sphingopyxis sp. (strain 113P3) TaxID=292913 RepID=UPI003FA380A8
MPPGKRAWPFHGHHANEELFVILSGSGRLRYSDGDHALRAGDVALCPASGAASAPDHQHRRYGPALSRHQHDERARRYRLSRQRQVRGHGRRRARRRQGEPVGGPCRALCRCGNLLGR